VIIESIDRQCSSETELACRTAPPLDQCVFQHFCALLKSAGKLDAVKFREDGGRLYITAASWTPQLRDTIDSLLTSAENASAQAQKAQAETTRLERHKKDRAIEAAAKALGVPIK
jgi:molybdopterin-guanine dinucleotide biosynthesis protein A